MQLTVITVGTLKEEYLKCAVAEYKKRILQYAKVEEISIKEEKIHDEDNPNQIERALRCEGEKIIAAVPRGARVIALCVEGKQYTSEGLSELVREAEGGSGKLALIIGSSHGLSPEVKASADIRLSVSKMTFPHQLMRVVLYEALYRSFTIISGKKYHK